MAPCRVGLIDKTDICSLARIDALAPQSTRATPDTIPPLRSSKRRHPNVIPGTRFIDGSVELTKSLGL